MVKNTRLSSVVIKNVPFTSLRSKWCKIPKGIEQTIIARLTRTGPISIRQYKELFGEPFYYSNKINYFKVKDVLSGIRATFPNLYQFKNELLVSHHSNFKTVKLYHNYTNIDNIIRMKQKYNVESISVLFDDETIEKTSDGLVYGSIKSDGVIINGDEVIFIETDMGTEPYEILRAKGEKYNQWLNIIKKETIFKSGKVIFFSGEQRILNLKLNGIFSKLDSLGRIDFYSN